MLKDNLKNVEERVQEACDRAGRKREEVTLIAVSKTKPIEMLQEIYDENIRDFGENKVQELCDKIEKMPKDIKWHMIGHLQRNKVKYIVGQVALIHSVDSYRLAEEINIQAKKKNIIVPILVEVNIAHEESKFGISEEDAIQLVEEIAELEASIKDYITQCQAKWVAGQSDINADWDGYLEQLDKLGLDQYLEYKGAVKAE